MVFYTIQGAFLFYILGNPFIFDTESPVRATQFPDTESRRRNIIPVLFGGRETGPSPALLKLHFGYCPHFLTNKIILQLPDGSIKPEKLCIVYKESSLNAKNMRLYAMARKYTNI